VLCLFCWMWLGIANLPPLCLPDAEHVPPAAGPAACGSRRRSCYSLLPAAACASLMPSTQLLSPAALHTSPIPATLHAPTVAAAALLPPPSRRARSSSPSLFPSQAVHADPAVARAACSSPIGHAACPLRKAFLAGGFGREPAKK
jgi:hypothetical protein